MSKFEKALQAWQKHQLCWLFDFDNDLEFNISVETRRLTASRLSWFLDFEDDDPDCIDCFEDDLDDGSGTSELGV